jgi:hypothetical protein
MPPKMFMGPLMEGEPGSGGGDGKGPVALDDKAVNAMINGALAKFAKDTLPNVVKEAATAAVSGLSGQLTTLTENLTTLQSQVKPPVDDKDKNKPGEDGLTPAARAEFQKIQKALDTANANFAAEKTAREKAEAASALDRKNSAIRSELSQFQYASPEAAEDAFASVSAKIEQDADGNYVADGLLLKDYVSTFIPEKKSYLLAQVDKGGSGASGGRGRTTPSKIDMDDITVANMADPKKAQAVAAAIAQQLRAAGAMKSS